MPTIKATLTLSASAGQVSTNALALTESDTLTIDAVPGVGISRAAINVSGGAAVTLIPSSAEVKFLYVKNTALQSDGTTSTTNIVEVSIGGNSVLRVNPNEWAWVPVVASAAVTAISSSTQTILVEYAYFTRS